MRSNIVRDILDDPDLVAYLRSPPHTRNSNLFEKIKLKMTFKSSESTIQPNKKPLPSSSKNIIIKCNVASETSKAFNFKVLLNGSKYPVTFPFKPALYIWMPKSCSWKVDNEYYEVVKFMAMENLDKAFMSLKKKLIADYGFTSSEIYKMSELHLL